MRSNLLLFIFLISLSVSQRYSAADEPSNPALDALVNASAKEIEVFFNSPAYRDRRHSDEQFLRDVYHGVLHREPDKEGFRNWINVLKTARDNIGRSNVVHVFLQSQEYLTSVQRKDTSRNPANVLFEKTGVFVNSASAFPVDRYAPHLRTASIVWIALQIDNGGTIRSDNVTSIETGWAKAWQAAGFTVGFWGCPRGIRQHNNELALAESKSLVEADAVLAVKLTSQYHGDFYIADCEDGYQGYSPNDSAPFLNRVYVNAFIKAAAEAGIAKIPRALSSMGRVALDMKPWIETGWDAMPQAYWNSYAVYQPSKCVDFYVKEGGWPIERVHPTIATYSGEGENRTVSLREYATDLNIRSTRGFSFYLPESYLGLTNNAAYEQLARMAK